MHNFPKKSYRQLHFPPATGYFVLLTGHFAQQLISSV
jgi:hypothetical protein